MFSAIALLVSGSLAMKLQDTETALQKASKKLEAQEQLISDMQASRDKERVSQRSTARQIGQLKNRISDLETNTPKLASTSIESNRRALRSEQEPEEARTRRNGTGRYVHFDVPEPGVAVWQNDNGKIQVSNDDPNLTGQVLSVRAEDELGNVRTMRIAVPAPRG